MTVSFPYNLVTNLGYVFDIQNDGRVSYGSNAFSGAFDWSDLRSFYSTDDTEVTLGGRGVELRNGLAYSNSNLTVSREAYVPEDGNYIRFLDTVTNTSSTAVTYVYRIQTNLASGSSSTSVLGSSSGDSVFGAGDTWVITDDSVDGNGGSDPVVGIWMGDGTVTPTLTGTYSTDIDFEIAISLQPGETRSFLHFGVQGGSLADVQAAINEIEAFTPDVLFGLSETDLARIVNVDTTDFVLPSTDYVGSTQPDVLSGTALDETFSGGDGADVVLTGDGDDRAEGGNGDDYIVATGGDNVLFGEQGADVLRAGAGNDTLSGGEGDDLLIDSGGQNRLDGGGGGDRIVSGDGSDVLLGDGSGTQTASDVVIVPQTQQQLAVTLTVPDTSDTSTIEISGFINRAPAENNDFNIVYVIDVSGSTSSSFVGNETVGDLNGDGYANQLVDGIIQGFLSLNESVVQAGLGLSDVSIVAFDSTANTVYAGVASSNGVELSLTALDEYGGSTYFDRALQETIAALSGMGAGANRVFFLSDGYPNGGSYTDEVATLIDPNGLNASIRAIGLGNSASLTSLDLLDDGVANNSAERVLTPSELTAGLTGSPVQSSEISQLVVSVNGVAQRILQPTDFTVTPLGLQYQITLSGLNISADDVVTVDLVASDPQSTTASVSLTVPNLPQTQGDDTIFAGGGNDVVQGNGGNDSLFGEAGNDFIDGGSGNDFIDGGAGDDALAGGSGNDRVVGGAGLDVANYSGSIGDVTGYRFGTSIILVTPSEGTDLLSGVESLRFTATGTTEITDFADRDPLQYIASNVDLLQALGANSDAGIYHLFAHGLAEGRALDTFDEWSYLASNSDLIGAFGPTSGPAARHYIEFGFAEGRALDTFDEWSYMASNVDLITAFGGNSGLAASHYVLAGYWEGRPLDTFDEWSYLASNLDLVAPFGGSAAPATSHYVLAGYSEGRALDTFDEWSYLASNTDLITAWAGNVAPAAQHYALVGAGEGRALDTFDEWSYLASNTDLINVFGPDGALATQHYALAGFAEGRARDSFDELRYIASNPDLIPIFGTNGVLGTTHYVQAGFSEGRSATGFNAAQYLANYADLQAVYGSDLAGATEHYILAGYAEGRTDAVI